MNTGPARNPSNITVDCSDRERMDRAALEMTIYGDRDHVMPLTDAAALSDHCPRLKAAELVVKAYSRQCFKPFPQQVIGMLVKGNAQELKKRCSTPEGRAEFVGYAQCTPQINWDAAHTCMDTYIRQLEATRDTVTDLDKKLPYTCCYFHKFKKVCIIFMSCDLLLIISCPMMTVRLKTVSKGLFRCSIRLHRKYDIWNRK